MQYIAYMFELKSIQSYIMAGGKLKDMVNASDLLEQLTSEQGWLDSVLSLTDIHINSQHNEPLVKFSRRAGGAIYLISEHDQANKQQQKLIQFRLLWSMIVQQILPDCEFVDCLTKPCDNAFLSIEQGRKKLLQQRSLFYPSLPLSTPFTRIAQRTGTAAVTKIKDEWLDKASEQKRRYYKAKSNLTQKFCTETDISWPHSLDYIDFPYKSKEEKDIAIVHIDGNGLGQILINLAQLAQEAPDGYIKLYSAFSEQLKKATESAAQQATKEVLLPNKAEKTNLLAARPLILGGDDLTLIIRADLALLYSKVFIQSFENNSRKIKKELKKIFKNSDKYNKRLIANIPEQLTASGGIVFQKASQPFIMGYKLAESLCQQAKNVSKKASTSPITSSVCFYQIQGSVTDNYSVLLRNELSSSDKSQQLTLGVYGIGDNIPDSMPKLQDLHDLVDFLQQEQQEGISAKLRQWISLLLLDHNVAFEFYEQFDKTIQKHNKGASYDQLKILLEKIHRHKREKLCWFNSCEQSPLVDLISLTALEKK